MGISYFDIPNSIYNGVTSEVSCAVTCAAHNPVNGPYQIIQFYPGSQQCACKYSAALSYPQMNAYTLTNIAMVGSCASYVKNLPTNIYPCQDVTYPVSGCVATDGSLCSQNL